MSKQDGLPVVVENGQGWVIEAGTYYLAFRTNWQDVIAWLYRHGFEMWQESSVFGKPLYRQLSDYGIRHYGD